MQIRLTTDYAIRVVLALGQKGKILTMQHIAEEMKIPEKFLSKVIKLLKEENLVSTVRGVNGGLYLRKELSEITLLDILQITEHTMKLNRCMEKDRYCSRDATSTCPIRKWYCYIQEEIEKKYLAVSLAEILEWESGESKKVDEKVNSVMHL